MNNLSQCPFCRGPLEKGSLLGDRYSLKWLPDGNKLFLGIWAFGGKSIGKRGSWNLGRPRADGIRCSNCRKIILDE